MPFPFAITRKLVYFAIATILLFISIVVLNWRFDFIGILLDYTTNLIIGAVTTILKVTGINDPSQSNYINLSEVISPFLVQEYLMKKVVAVVLLIIWFTPASTRLKVLTTIAILPVHFIAIVLKTLSVAFLFIYGLSQNDAWQTARIFVYLSYLLLLLIWLRHNPAIFDRISEMTKSHRESLERKTKILIRVILIFLGIEFILAVYSFEPWIQFLFTTCKYILNFFHYHSVVDGFYLLGDNGNVYMAKACLGIRATYIFAAFVYLTGKNTRKKVLFILIGVIIINIANILRLVFLFIHLQNHGMYLWKIEVHDMFNILVYSIVFILWVIWLEWYTDIWKNLRNKTKEVMTPGVKK